MSILDIKTEDFLAWKPTPVNGKVIHLKNPQVIRMDNIDVLFESETHNKEDTAVLVKVLKTWNESSYTTGHVARDHKGRPCGYDAPQATQWDCYGILLKCSDSIEQADRIASFMETHRAVNSQSLVTWGDNKQFYEVLPIFRDTCGFLAELSQRETWLKELRS